MSRKRRRPSLPKLEDRAHGTSHLPKLEKLPRYEGGASAKIPAYNPRKPAPVPLPAHSAKKKDHGHSVGGLVKNFATDVKDTAVGIGPGLVHTVQHPIRAAHQTVDTYKNTYANVSLLDIIHDKNHARSKFSHSLDTIYQHPLGPALDLTTVLDVGSTAGLRAGLIPGGRKVLETRSPRAIARGGAGPVKKTLSDTKPIVRARQAAVNAARQKLPYDAPIVGEAKRYGKQIARDAQKVGLKETVHYHDYLKATKGLSDKEWVALNIRARDVHPTDLAEYWKGTPNEKIVRDLKVVDLAENPSKRLLKAEAASRALSQEAERIAKEEGVLRDTTAANRPGQLKNRVQAKINRNAPPPAEPYVSNGIDFRGGLPDEAHTKGFLYHRTSLDKFETIRREGLEPLKPAGDHPVGVYFAGDPLSARGLSWKRTGNVYLRVARNKVKNLDDSRAFGEYLTPSKVPARDLEYLGADGTWHPIVGRQVRELHGDPYYIPDALEPAKGANPFQSMGGGRGIPKVPGTFKQNKGHLAAIGKLDLKHDVLGPEFLRRVKLKVHSAIHEDLLDGSVPVTHDWLAENGLPKGYRFVRARLFAPDSPVAREITHTPFAPEEIHVGMRVSPRDRLNIGTIEAVDTRAGTATVHFHNKKTGLEETKTFALSDLGKRDTTSTKAQRAMVRSKFPHSGLAQKVPATLKQQSERSLEDLIPNPADLHNSRLSEDLGTVDREQAFKDGMGRYYIAPERAIRSAAGEFHRSSTAVRQIVERPLSVWRAIILGTRVGFLTNNVVGNHILYTLRAAGNKGLSSYLHAVMDAKGPAVVRRLLNDPATPQNVSQQFMREFFPDQIEGTFGETQSPVQSKLVQGKTQRRAKKLGMGIIPHTQAVAEGIPRRAMVESMVRSSPEFKRAVRELPKEQRSFDAAARRVLHGEGGKEYQAHISDKVNSALGSYLDLTPFERNTVRNVLPFYAWYRAIAKVTYHLAADTPGRALAIQKLGVIGSEDTDKILGKLPSYLKGFIPFGKPKNGEVTGMSTQGMNPFATISQLERGGTEDLSNIGLNPFLQAALDAYAKHHETGNVSLPAVLGDMLKTTGQSLPPYRLAFPPGPSLQYPERDRLTELLAQLGVPIKKPNLAIAHERAIEGR